ncbi:MAG: hypothetical protein NT062_15080 [Proteobacteria bacterium]|nr:hypothetical protein [Pseudomonadota bacterium]
MSRSTLLVATLLLTSSTSALADDDAPSPNYDDGYCDYVQGVGSAQSALQLAPSLFGQFGYIEQTVTSSSVATTGPALRFVGGVKYKLSGIYEGFATRSRAKADCDRHVALNQVRGGTAYRALEARNKILEGALPEAAKILAATDEDFKAHRITAQEFTATRLRIEELRGLAVETRRQMSALPPASDNLAGSLKAFQRADETVEAYEGKLRMAQAFDFSVRFGLDAFLEGQSGSSSPVFAVASLDINIGALFVGSANERASTGRKKLVRSGHDPLAVDATADRLRVVVETESKRLEETAALEGDLQKQLDVLARVGGDDSRRFRLTIWFEWIKVSAEHAYLQTHIAAIKQVIGA